MHRYAVKTSGKQGGHSTLVRWVQSSWNKPGLLWESLLAWLGGCYVFCAISSWDSIGDMCNRWCDLMGNLHAESFESFSILKMIPVCPIAIKHQRVEKPKWAIVFRIRLQSITKEQYKKFIWFLVNISCLRNTYGSFVWEMTLTDLWMEINPTNHVYGWRNEITFYTL